MTADPHDLSKTLHSRRAGSGPRILLLHGLGGNIDSWRSIAPELAKTNEVTLVDLPGHGKSPSTPCAGTFSGVADGIADFIRSKDLEGISVAGHSLGGRVALELARRSLVGPTVALAPGGFWNAWEGRFVKASLLGSGRLVRSASGMLPFLTSHRAGRAALLAQISARPARVPPATALQELRSFAATPTFDDLVRDLTEGPAQEGTGESTGLVTIVWGRRDRLLFPRQAERAVQAFPDSRLEWIEACGHYIQWDAPEDAMRLIRSGTRRDV